jgi:hypothetical protein
MTNHDVDPAASEPNSIAPMAFDTNRWTIDLNNLHTGERFDFSIPKHANDDDDVPTALRGPRRGRRVLGAMTAVALVAGLGCAAFFARPSLQRALASSTSRVAQTTMTASPAPLAPPVAPAPPVVAATPVPAAPPPPVAIPTPAPSAQGKAAKAIPTFSTSALPNAPKKATKRRGK